MLQSLFGSSPKFITKDLAIQQQIQAELIRLLYMQIRPGLLGEIFAVSLIFITLNEIIPFQWLALWYLSAVLIALIRYRLIHQYLDANPPPEAARKWLIKFIIGAIFSAIIWGLAGSMLIPEAYFLYQFFIILLLIGVSAAASPYYSPVPFIYTIFLTLAFVPFTIWLLAHGSYIYILLGIAAVIFAGLMLGTCYYNHKMLADSLNLRFTNSALMDDLKQAKKQLEEVNKDLYAEIQERKQIQTTLQDLATHDVLTQLPNRTLFHERLVQAINHAKRNKLKVAIILIDIDNFKKINNAEGHNAGDRLLQNITERLKQAIRSTDMVARLGGDEFVVLAEDINNEHEAAAIARKICTRISEKFRIENTDIYLSASVGISFYPTDGDNTETLLKYADIAMYRAKEAGKNNFQFYTPSLHTAVVRKQTIENHLRKAIESEEFVVYYQPFFDLRHHKIIGMEALIRWQHPEHGLIPPLQFIPIAEETGLIIPIGEWVLRTACAQNKLWEQAGYRLELGVNISAIQFNEENLPRLINDILMETGLASSNLNLELTESLAMQNAEHTIASLNQLNEIGVLLSIDDFGTGYSSLSYLKRFPIDTLKIDRSFIADIQHDHDDAMITSAIIDMAHALKLKVIAEGVEYKAQYDFLQQKNCDLIQGYLISKPVLAAEFEQLLQKK